jgi:hypothetical protein
MPSDVSFAAKKLTLTPNLKQIFPSLNINKKSLKQYSVTSSLFKTDDTSIATVDSTGIVGVKVGKTKLEGTFTINGEPYTASMDVEVISSSAFGPGVKHEKKKMSTGALVGIIVGAVVVAAAIAIAVGVLMQKKSIGGQASNAAAAGVGAVPVATGGRRGTSQQCRH